MSKAVANVDANTDTWGQLITKVNLLADALSNEVVTANSTLGNTSGNSFVDGIVAANTVVALNELKGGTITTNSSALPEITTSNLNITSNVTFASGTTVTNRAVTNNSNTTNFTANITANGALTRLGSPNTLVTGNVNLSNSVVTLTNGVLHLNTANVTANGSLGQPGDVLYSNGSATYWASAPTGGATVVDSVSNTSNSLAASANAAKTAYDAAVSANTLANSALANAISLSTAAFTNAASRADTAFSNAVAIATNASAMTTGTVPAGRLSGTYSISITGSASSANSVPWTGVTGRPTAISSFTIDRGWRYQTSAYQLGGRVFVTNTTPTAVANGDIWISGV